MNVKILYYRWYLCFWFSRKITCCFDEDVIGVLSYIIIGIRENTALIDDVCLTCLRGLDKNASL